MGVQLKRIKLGSDLSYTDIDPDHITEFNGKDLLELLKDTGLGCIDAEHRCIIQSIWCKPSNQ